MFHKIGILIFFYLFDSYNIYYDYFYSVRIFRIVEPKYIVKLEGLAITAEDTYVPYFSDLGIKLINYIFCILQKLPPKSIFAWSENTIFQMAYFDSYATQTLGELIWQTFHQYGEQLAKRLTNVSTKRSNGQKLLIIYVSRHPEALKNEEEIV